jgi:hypothetical protein
MINPDPRADVLRLRGIPSESSWFGKLRNRSSSGEPLGISGSKLFEDLISVEVVMLTTAGLITSTKSAKLLYEF